MPRLLNRAALREEKGIPFGDSHLRRLIEAGNFPKPVRFNNTANSHRMWFEHVIDDYLKNLEHADMGAEGNQPPEASEA